MAMAKEVKAMFYQQGFQGAYGEMPTSLYPHWNKLIEFVERSGVLCLARACNVDWTHDEMQPDYDVVLWRLK